MRLPWFHFLEKVFFSFFVVQSMGICIYSLFFSRYFFINKRNLFSSNPWRVLINKRNLLSKRRATPREQHGVAQPLCSSIRYVRMRPILTGTRKDLRNRRALGATAYEGLRTRDRPGSSQTLVSRLRLGVRMENFLRRTANLERCRGSLGS
jgi:hypothetical protein